MVAKTADFKGWSAREGEAAEYSEIRVGIPRGYLTSPICALAGQDYTGLAENRC